MASRAVIFLRSNVRSSVLHPQSLQLSSFKANFFIPPVQRYSDSADNANKSGKVDKTPLKKAYTPVGKHDDGSKHRDFEKEPLAPFPDDVNPITGEKGGPRGPEPTRYGDWERKGRCIDF